VSAWKPGQDLPKSCTAIVAGPGLAADDLPDKLRSWIKELWRESSLPMLIDASALVWLEPCEAPHNSIRVITPHPGEAARMLQITSREIQSDRLGALRGLSKRFGDCWVILKGHETLIGKSAGPVTVNSSGNPFLAQGGSGDALSGFMGGLLAQPELQRTLEKTLSYAVWAHGAAADRLQNSGARWTIEDLLETLGNGSNPPSTQTKAGTVRL
jgi:NAD(P)H-hydrate epimerase